jgi:hypothetical protein
LEPLFHLILPVIGKVLLAGPEATTRDRLTSTGWALLDVAAMVVDPARKDAAVMASPSDALEPTLRPEWDRLIGLAFDADRGSHASHRRGHLLIAVVANRHVDTSLFRNIIVRDCDIQRH